MDLEASVEDPTDDSNESEANHNSKDDVDFDTWSSQDTLKEELPPSSQPTQAPESTIKFRPLRFNQPGVNRTRQSPAWHLLHMVSRIPGSSICPGSWTAPSTDQSVATSSGGIWVESDDRGVNSYAVAATPDRRGVMDLPAGETDHSEQPSVLPSICLNWARCLDMKSWPEQMDAKPIQGDPCLCRLGYAGRHCQLRKHLLMIDLLKMCLLH
ncbi:unnamed protein product [Protopolystoma xenopodis]|uniref:EGF-like domain-containing protein n=1 Tax=Protopolystoma xenopodis TaxID=117903 RepID=A0A448XPN7_9PLAT|nr:unnamed protein product [Protopolystoma xenopodis]